MIRIEVLSRFDLPVETVFDAERDISLHCATEHHFRSLAPGRCEKRDVLDIEAPLGPLGWIEERLFLAAYMRRFLERKNADLKAILEREGYPPR